MKREGRGADRRLEHVVGLVVGRATATVYRLQLFTGYRGSIFFSSRKYM